MTSAGDYCGTPSHHRLAWYVRAKHPPTIVSNWILRLWVCCIGAWTKSSADVAEGPRDAMNYLKIAQLFRTYLTYHMFGEKYAYSNVFYNVNEFYVFQQ